MCASLLHAKGDRYIKPVLNQMIPLCPSKHDTLKQCWFNVGRRRRRWANIKPLLGQRPMCAEVHESPANTKCTSNDDAMPDNRLRHWSDITATLGQHLVFAGGHDSILAQL